MGFDYCASNAWNPRLAASAGIFSLKLVLQRAFLFEEDVGQRQDWAVTRVLEHLPRQ